MEITFSKGFARSLRQALPTESILFLPLEVQWGDLTRLNHPTPKAFALPAKYGEQSATALSDQLSAAIQAVDATDEALRVWYDDSADGLGGFLWVCQHLQKRAFDLAAVHVPRWLPNWQADDSLLMLDNIDELTPESVVALTAKTATLPPATWHALGYGFLPPTADVHADLRVNLNGQLVSVDADFYDRFITGQKPSAVTGLGLAMPAWWTAYRLDVLHH